MPSNRCQRMPLFAAMPIAAWLAVVAVTDPTVVPASAAAMVHEEEWGGAAAGGACAAAKAEWLAEAGSFDPETGREYRNFPPDRLVDHLSMTLRMRFPDLSSARFTATETLRVRGIGVPVHLLRLDAVGFRVDAVRRDGVPAPFAVDDESISVQLEPPLESGEEASIEIDYECRDPADGMIFSHAVAEKGLSAEIHTQGQPDTNRYWFACHDFPNERLSTELIVDVPAGYQVSSNGRLVSQETQGDRAVWHYLQERPHVNYLVSLVIGQFDRVELPPPRSGVPLTVWAPKGRGPDAQRTYERTGAMIDLFERRFGTPYPWKRYDQLIVRNFGAGGMENTSATTMYPTAVFDERALLDGDLDGLISHELGHQWFGDLVTCRSWAHIWLNEGWATYCSALWQEESGGREAYLDSIRGSFQVARRDTTDGEVGMVSTVYGSPNETFGRRPNPYPKGASILHMLRAMLGEELFFEGVRRYLERYGDQVAETDDFRHAMEQVSGLDLEWFFEQWCRRPGTPQVKATARYDAATGEVVVDVEQTQSIDARTPAFRFELPVLAIGDGGETAFRIDVRDRKTTYRTKVAGVPSMIVVDPELHVLKSLTLDLPFRMLLEQARRGPTIAARRDAIEALRARSEPEVVELMTAIVRDSQRRHTERVAAFGALQGFDSSDAKESIAALIAESDPDARLRVAFVDAAADLPRAEAIPILAKVAANDESYACRARAVEGLGKLKSAEHADLLVELVDYPSQSDQVRNAALGALAELDDARGLDLAIRCAELGNPDRARPRAVAAMGRLAHHDRERTIDLLLELLKDPESRTAYEAGDALA
ncbi:MAG: HEAT repeat domain-containing protein, partial [Phycisphaerales bacterium]|nr:HEAT repeat domain-containing protein [Phycisphaerales bacterium]